MRNLLIPVIAAIVVSAPIAKGQTTDSLQGLKKILAKNARDVSSVKVDQCKLTFKRTRGGAYDARQASGFVGGGFPMDESSGYLSSGADRSLPQKRSSDVVEVDLSAFDTTAITSRPATRFKGKTLIWLSVGESNYLVKPNGPVTANGIGFIVDNKNTGPTVEALENAIASCRID